MTFVNITLLAGTALVALPIVLHLIMRRKPKHFEFPALRLVQKRHDTNQRRLRLRHLLLLLLRIAAIALLAFALARPSVNFGGAVGSQESPVAAALVLDSAMHMQYRQDNQTRLEAGKELAQWLLAQLPPESQVAVLDARLGPASFQVDRGAAKQRIEQLEPTSNAQPLPSVLETALDLLEESPLPQKEIYVFTDLVQSSWPATAAARLQARLNAVPANIYLIDVGVHRPVNYGLSELRLSAQVLSNRSALGIGGDVYHTADQPAPGAATAPPDHAAPAGSAAPTDNAAAGNATARPVELALLDAARQPQKRAEDSVSLAPGQSQQFEFAVGSLAEGVQQGVARIIGQDGLPADDVRYFTAAVRPPWQILLVAPTPAEQYAQFLDQALAPAGLRQQGRARFECKILDQGRLGDEDLSPYAAICLLDPEPLPPLVWRKLIDFVGDGRGLAIFLGRNVRPLEAFNSNEPQDLLPGVVLPQVRRPDGDTFIAPRNYEHPILTAFRQWAGSVPWPSFPVFNYWQFQTPPEGVTTVLSLNDDGPLLFERRVGAGRVLTMATPVSDRPDADAWNLLPVGENPWPFVALVNRMVDYLVGSNDVQLNYTCGQPVILKLDTDDVARSWVLLTPDGLNVPLAVDPQRETLTITTTDQPGNYRVAAGEGRRLGFSVNLSPAQTDLTRIDNQELKSIFAAHPIRIATSREEIDRSVSLGRVGREMFPLLILLVVAVMAAEHLAANRFYRE